MAFAPVSDRFHEHPKVLELIAKRKNFDGLGLWILALSYTTGQLLDGVVPSWFPKKVAGRRGKRLAEALVKVGLWDVSGDGWVFHDFLEWQKSSLEIKNIRASKRQAGHLGGLAKALADAKARAIADAKANGRLDSQHSAIAPATAYAIASAIATPTSNQQPALQEENLGERENRPLGGKTIHRGGSRLTDAGAPPTGTEGRPPRLVTPNVAELFLSLQASETSEDEQQAKAAKLAEYQAYLERNGLTPGQETC
jgi:hypothetical protein